MLMTVSLWDNDFGALALFDAFCKRLRVDEKGGRHGM